MKEALTKTVIIGKANKIAELPEDTSGNSVHDQDNSQIASLSTGV
jgi:hypothetical protein